MRGTSASANDFDVRDVKNVSAPDDAPSSTNGRVSVASAPALWLRALRTVVLLVGAVHLGFVVWVIVQRFLHPVDLEWMSGGVFDHVERVRQGEPLYVAPSASFIPFLYPPLYYWLSATLASLLPLQAACRVVSVVAIVATLASVFRATRTLGKSTYWALVACSLYLGAYSLTGYWYDLERSDSLLMAMLTGGFVVLLESEGLVGATLAGALLGGAFLAKQPASIFFGAAVVSLVLAHRVKHALAVAVGGLAVLVPSVAWLNAKSDGWFWFYCVKMPSSHGAKAELATLFFVVDATKGFALLGATGAVLARFFVDVVRRVRERTSVESKEALLGSFVFAAFLTSATSRMHIGGYVNVLVFWTTFAAIGFGAICARLESTTRARALHGVLAGVALLQLGHMLYDPSEASPNSGRVRDASIVEARIRELEKRGEVLVPGRGHLTRSPHFHAIALMDILRGGLPIPPDLVTGLEQRRYAAYVIDEFGELSMEPILGHRSELYALVTRNYFIAQRLDDREPPPVVGWIAHPSWVLRPRSMPLPSLTVEQLERRQRLEMGLAEMRMRAVQAGARKVDDGDDIEGLAEQIDTAGTHE